MSRIDQKLLRIGVFYDGGFFYHISNYYRYSHPEKKRISIPGLHEFIRQYAAREEGIDVHYSQIVDSHFFRGRFSAQQSQAHEKLYAERAFDDVLMNEGVTTHYLPIFNNTEKGIDVWLSLEAYELALHKRYNILVLIAGDSDFLPLIRKINSLGSRVMVLGWEFDYTDNMGVERYTATSRRLLNEVTYPVMMHDIINSKTEENARMINGLFVDAQPYSSDSKYSSEPETAAEPTDEADDAPAPPAEAQNRVSGSVLSLKEGYGFIRCEQHPENVFFHFSSLVNCDFDDLIYGDDVTFLVLQGDRGPTAQDVELVKT